MSSVVELDKENQEQTVSRKVVVPESSAPRTPFGDVNRRRSVAADPTGSFLKCSQLPAKRRSWAPDGLVQRQAYSSSDAVFTPLRNKAKETSLKKQIQKDKEDLEGHEERKFCTQTTEAMCFSSSQASGPVMKLPKSDSTEQFLPVSSQSCPDVLSDNLPLPPIKETSPEKPTACLSVAVGDLPALSPEQNTPHSPDLSMSCEEGTPLALRDLSCKTESDVDLSYDCGDLSGCPTPALGMSSSSVMSDEGISSEADSPEKNAILTGTCGLQGMIASVSEQESESVQAACFILDEILEAVEEQTMMNHPEGNDVKGTCQTFSNTHAPYGQTFLSEYARFVESYSREESPFCMGRTSSLTDVTPCSQDLEVESSTSTVGCAAPSDGQPVMVDSFGSSFLDSDKSFSSTGTVQRQLTFEDRDMRSPEANLDESFGFVRSSESKVDLREHPGGVTPYKLRTERGDSAEQDFLNLSLSDQGVEFIALPPKLRSVASSPIDVQNQNQSCSSVSVWGNTSPLSGTASQETGTPTSAELMKDVAIIAAGAEVKSTLEAVKSSAVQTTPRLAHTHSIAVSPIPAEVCEQEANTSIIQTVDVDTMTLALLTTEVALSPMPVARKEVDTMTTIAVTTDVGMATESAECLDHSMLATAETDSKTTMTDNTGHRNVFTTMTPLKTLAKEGQRLTSNDIRKQHPRALANQLETLTVANSRLESQVRSAQQDHKRLQGALKEAKQLASSRQSELEAADRLKQEEWEQKERELTDRYQHLEEESQQQQSRVVGLEQELLTMRAESEATTQRQLEDLRVMEEKCQVMEETHARSAKQYQLEIEELKKNQEANSYRHQFERAQQMVREREAEVKEIRELFADLQNTACQQEKIHSAYQQMHKKIIVLASENQTLRDSIANRTWLSREEAECKQAEMEALQEDEARLEEEVQSLKNTLAIHTTNLAELEKLYSVSSTDLLTATGRVVELNSELFAARKALQEAVLSKETMCRHSQELEEQLWGLRDMETSLRAALQHTQDQLELQIQAHEKLQSVSQKMKKVYEDKIENMALGVENLQRTLENREVDMNNLEKDLYEVRNIIVEQRYRIDGLEADLRDARNEAAAKKAEEEDIEFFKESNAFLEAERSLYVQSIRDLEENLKATSLESVRHKQVAADAEQLVEELQEDKLRLISELSQAQSQYVTTSKALSQAREEREAMEADLMVAANDLLQHMQLMLTKLKTKIGLQEMPEVYPLEAQPPRPPHHSKSVKSKRHSRKSFVSSILGAATKVSEQGAESNATEQDNDQWESGSYLGEAMTDSVRKIVAAKSAKLLNASSASNTEGSMVKRDVREVTVTTADTTLKDQSLSRLDTSSGCSDSHPALSASRRKLHFSDHQPLSVSWTESSTCHGAESGAHAGRSAHASPSSLPSCPPYSLLHPPSSEPLSSGLAKVRSIPRTHYNPAMLRPGQPSADKEGERGMMGCMLSLKEVFSSISRMASIVDRATQLSLQDLREENDILRKRTEILEGWVDRNKAELMVSQQESADKDNTIVKLRQQFQEMTEQMMNFTDQKFQIRRLREEVKRLESDLQHERSEKEVVSAELDSQLRRLESAGAGASQAHRLRDLVALKKKNGQLMIQLEEQRNHYENLGSKAARRMRVLDENWKKAEDELYRLDEVVESIKQIAEHSSSPVTDLQKILRLIQGETKVSPL